MIPFTYFFFQLYLFEFNQLNNKSNTILNKRQIWFLYICQITTEITLSIYFR